MYFDPTMTLDEYEDYKLRDEINIGYEVEEDFPDAVSYTHLTLPTMS